MDTGDVRETEASPDESDLMSPNTGWTRRNVPILIEKQTELFTFIGNWAGSVLG